MYFKHTVLAAWFCIVAALPYSTQAQTVPAPGILISRGEVVADFRADAAAGDLAWTNHATGPSSVGSITRSDKKPLLVETIAGPAGRPVSAIRLDKRVAGVVLRSGKPVPAAITGDGSVSVETWILAAKPLEDDATIIAYGSRERGEQRQFLYGTRKPFSGYFADASDWGSFNPRPLVWYYLAWVYDRDATVMTVYVDGQQVKQSHVSLETTESPMVLGLGPSQDTPGEFDYDPINAYIASVRVCTGVLSAVDVKANFESGVSGAAGKSPIVAPFVTPVAGEQLMKVFTDPSPASPPESKTALWYRQPARSWIEAMPLGNGRLGAMVFGGIDRERVGLNEDTLWSGGPYDPAVEVPPETIERIRELSFAGKHAEAQNLAGELQGRPNTQASYQTVGELRLAFPTLASPSSYRRELDIDTAISTVSFTAGGVRYKREYFVSPVDQVIVIRLTADKPGQISLDATLWSPQARQKIRSNGNEIVLDGENGNIKGKPVVRGALKFESRVHLAADGGQTDSASDGVVSVRNADSVTLFVAAATSYKSYSDVSGDPETLCKEALSKLQSRSYDSMKQDTSSAHQLFFHRVLLDLGDSNSPQEPTDQRLAEFNDNPDPNLAALYFQFGRYLLISSSRPGGQPANLQGLWNQDLLAAWGGKYTVNINTEMNYWPSLATNLPEMQEPLLMLVHDCSITGAVTAKKIYHARGWVLHHNTDLWRATAPIDGPFYGQWQTGGAWLCNTLYEEYLFDADRKYLQTLYPLIKGSAQFFLDTLVEEPTHHWLVTCPANSPEHEYKAGLTNSPGPTMDVGILRELFANCASAARVLGVDGDFAAECDIARSRLAPYQVGHAGQLQEWIEDMDTDAPEIEHRHMSPLYGLYPGNDINPTNPRIFAAARKLMEMRAGNVPGQMGWAIAWRAALWARLGDAEMAGKLINSLIGNHTESNFFDKPSVQLDGNFGGTAAIAEMLLQSQTGEINLLPALPKEWAKGKVTGLRARGGFAVNIEWNGGKLTRAKLDSSQGGVARVRYEDQIITLNIKPADSASVSFDGVLKATPSTQPK